MWVRVQVPDVLLTCVIAFSNYRVSTFFPSKIKGCGKAILASHTEKSLLLDDATSSEPRETFAFCHRLVGLASKPIYDVSGVPSS